VFFVVLVQAQKQVAVIAFWNVENLYDTIDDPLKNDNEFTPSGTFAWTSERYAHKLDRLAEVISQIGSDVSEDGAVLVGLCEVENRKVLEDLVSLPALKDRRYQIVLHEGPDMRGIDPALLYSPDYFKEESTKAFRVRLPDSTHRTRDVLLVNGQLKGEPVAVFLNHWPSRRMGEKASRPSRIAVAQVVKRASDSIRKADPSRKIILLGDFNDDPVSYSVKEVLCSSDDREHVEANCFFNPMYVLFRKGIGTLAWNDRWNLFDQVLFSPAWLKGDGWVFSEAKVFNKDFMCNREGNFKGYPFRTYNGGVYAGGYSDHFPSYVVISRGR
jgi:hypothetical protein